MLNHNFFQDRQFFLHLLELELKRSLRYQSFTSVLLIELPSSRLSTPAILERVANSLSSQIRVTDVIGTTRENMITLILLNCDNHSSSEVANRVSSWISQYFGSESVDGVSGSRSGVGTACFPTHATDSEHLLSAASEMLEASRRQPEIELKSESLLS